MKTKIIEATDGVAYGKFLVGVFDTEWQRRSLVAEEAGEASFSLLRQEGWGPEHTLVLDLSVPGNGGIFAIRRDGYPAQDIAKHQLEICWLYERFLGWLYQQDISTLDLMPDLVHFPAEEEGKHVPSG